MSDLFQVSSRHTSCKTEDNSAEKTEENNTENDIVSSAYELLGQESCGNTGAGEEECVLAVVPVKLKSRKSEMCGNICFYRSW